MEKAQITHPLREENTYWIRTKIALKFWWRHFFTIPTGFLFIASLPLMGAVTIAMGIFLIWAIAFDNGKSIKQTGKYPERVSNFEDIPMTRKYYWNSDIAGTPAYLNKLSQQ